MAVLKIQDVAAKPLHDRVIIQADGHLWDVGLKRRLPFLKVVFPQNKIQNSTSAPRASRQARIYGITAGQSFALRHTPPWGGGGGGLRSSGSTVQLSRRREFNTRGHIYISLPLPLLLGKSSLCRS